MILPEIIDSLNEVESIASDWTVATCGNGPLTRAVRGQFANQHGRDPRLSAFGRILVVDDGSDATTIAKLANLLKPVLPGTKLPVTIIANVVDRSLCRAIENRCLEDGIEPRPVIVSEPDLIVESTMRMNRLFQIAKWRDQAKLNVAILGFGALGRSLLDEIVLDGISSGLEAPSIEILTTDVGKANAILRRDMPEIEKSAHIVVSPLNLDELGHPLSTPMNRAEESGPLTAIFVVLEGADQTLRAVAELCALQDLHGLAHASLFIGGAGADMAARLVAPRRTARNIAMEIIKLDDLQSLPDLLDKILIQRDVVAKRIHAAYEKQYLGETKAGMSWEVLSETYRRANRRAANHLVQKLDALGLDRWGSAKSNGTVDHQSYERVIMPLSKSSVEDQTMRNLARLEHERWCADRRIDGWSYGDIRDDSRRLHPSLVPFDDPRLTAGEIEKDVAQLRFLLGSVVEAAEDGATSSLTVGVVRGASQTGIDVKALFSRFSLEPQRDVIVISPMLIAAEVQVVAKVMAELKLKGRMARLIVPEWFAENATLRDSGLAGDASLKDLLGDDRCWITPIGPRRFSASAEWDEVFVDESRRQSLIDYVAKRADVLLAV